VRGGLAHREHEHKQPDPQGHDDQHNDFEIHFGTPFPY
jgi:hypothetical protein